MSDFIEIIRKRNEVQDDMSESEETNNNESYATQSNIGKIVFSKVKFLNKQYR